MRCAPVCACLPCMTSTDRAPPFTLPDTGLAGDADTPHQSDTDVLLAQSGVLALRDGLVSCLVPCVEVPGATCQACHVSHVFTCMTLYSSDLWVIPHPYHIFTLRF
jgi:hypothetical protein